MKFLLFLFFVFSFSFLYSERLPVDTTVLSPLKDTVRAGDHHHSNDNPDSIGVKNEKSEESNSESDGIISTWKLYTIMLAFPIILIIIFIFVYIRGKR